MRGPSAHLARRAFASICGRTARWGTGISETPTSLVPCATRASCACGPKGSLSDSGARPLTCGRTPASPSAQRDVMGVIEAVSSAEDLGTQAPKKPCRRARARVGRAGERLRDRIAVNPADSVFREALRGGDPVPVRAPGACPQGLLRRYHGDCAPTAPEELRLHSVRRLRRSCRNEIRLATSP